MILRRLYAVASVTLLGLQCCQVLPLLASAAAALVEEKGDGPSSDCADDTEGTCSSGSSSTGSSSTGSSSTMKSNNNPDDECGVWLALSTLEGTGIGMFAGKEFTAGQPFMMAGDHMVPIVDILAHNRDKDKNKHNGDGNDNDNNNDNARLFFLWDEYTWVRTNKYVK